MRAIDLTDPDGLDEGPETPSPVSGTSPLEALRATLRKEVERDPIVLVIPSRNGVSVKFDANIDADMLNAWRKKCQKRDRRTGMDVPDPVKLACTILGNQAREIRMEGQPVRVDGEPVLFYSPELHEMVGAHSTLEAVRMLFGVDGHLLDAADRVVDAAGYGDEVEEAPDPTVTRG